MSMLQRQSHSQSDDPLHQLECHINQGLEAATGRYEPQAFGAHRAPTDPYTAWLAQNELAREREDPARIRWVYRYEATLSPRSRPRSV
jgi:hypothetical protein